MGETQRPDRRAAKPPRYLNKTTPKLHRSNADRLRSTRTSALLSEVIVAHVELVFAGLDEDETRAFRGSLPALEDDCQYGTNAVERKMNNLHQARRTRQDKTPAAVL